VNGAENMIYMSSKSSSDGRYVLTCTFKVGANLDMANVDINNRVNKATAKLPQEAINYGISVKKKSPDILLAVSIYIVLWLSSRLYRVGILMYGKRATLPEMFRWLRYS